MGGSFAFRAQVSHRKKVRYAKQPDLRVASIFFEKKIEGKFETVIPPWEYDQVKVL